MTSNSNFNFVLNFIFNFSLADAIIEIAGIEFPKEGRYAENYVI